MPCLIFLFDLGENPLQGNTEEFTGSLGHNYSSVIPLAYKWWDFLPKGDHVGTDL